MATVVLVHGIWMNGWDMTVLRRRLLKAGFKVAQFSYPSITGDFVQSAAQLQRFVGDIADDEIHFVAHSLGGLLIRRLFHDFPDQKPGRIVTMGTPHNGSAVAKRLMKSAFGRHLLGNAAGSGLLGDVPPWRSGHQIAVIAGDRPLGVGMFFADLGKPNDGTVSVAETLFEGMAEHKVMHINHMGMMFSRQVAAEVISYLSRGAFSP